MAEAPALSPGPTGMSQARATRTAPASSGRTSDGQRQTNPWAARTGAAGQGPAPQRAAVSALCNPRRSSSRTSASSSVQNRPRARANASAPAARVNPAAQPAKAAAGTTAPDERSRSTATAPASERPMTSGIIRSNHQPRLRRRAVARAWRRHCTSGGRPPPAASRLELAVTPKRYSKCPLNAK
jgi:hypothetical protein